MENITAVKSPERDAELNSRLEKLRMKMIEYKISAYIIPNEDDHQNEEPAAADKRREYITGFNGTVGHALVTLNRATLWTDVRHYLQAEEQLTKSFSAIIRRKLVKISEMSTWLIENLKRGDTVGADPKKILASEWTKLDEILRESEIQLLPIELNIIDELWEDRPKYSSDPIYIHDLEYCGETYYRKVDRVRNRLKTSNCEMLVLSQLDEIAWLFNLRGNDLLYTPLFISYAIITNNSASLYIAKERITELIENHLGKAGAVVELKPYVRFWNDLKTLSQKKTNLCVPSKCSYNVYLMITDAFIACNTSPIIDMKAKKNDIEVQGSRKAHIRDAIAICALFKQMDEEVPAGVAWNEIKVAEQLNKLRNEFGQGLYKGPSFITHVAYGPNSALPYYATSTKTNLEITTSAPMTLDSGGQYLDATIDLARVVHFGEPSDFHRQIYTAILQGVADLADTVFVDGIQSESLEILARRPLLKCGRTFPHRVTHGTGIFNQVNEDYNKTYFKNFIGSQEPGYYLKDYFGMRLENLVVVVEAKIQEEENPKRLLTFSPLTLVPYERKLINLSMLDESQILWIDNYHEEVKRVVGHEMLKLGHCELFIWLEEKTKSLYSN